MLTRRSYPTNFALTVLAGSALFFTACGGDDTSDAGLADSGVQVDVGTAPVPDAGFPTDTGPRMDAMTTPRDAGHYCAPNTGVNVQGTPVTLPAAANTAQNPESASPDLTCIAPNTKPTVNAQIRFRGCVTFFPSARPSDAELSQLQIAVFKSKDAMDMPVDPSFNRATGAERNTTERINPQVVMDRQVSTTVCPSGVQVEIGRLSTGENTIRTDYPYIIRVRGSTTTATWAPVYHFGALVYADRLENGTSMPASCTPETCAGRVDLFAIKQSALADLATASGAQIPGAMNLNDGVGTGHLLVQANDCKDLPMRRAVIGVAPAPAFGAYLNADRMLDRAATETGALGLYVGLGFTATSSTPGSVAGAVGVLRSFSGMPGPCTEAFSGRKVPVFPDSVSVLRSGIEAALR